jgi:DNA-binding beta-propeller fold protein YncE
MVCLNKALFAIISQNNQIIPLLTDTDQKVAPLTVLTDAAAAKKEQPIGFTIKNDGSFGFILNKNTNSVTQINMSTKSVVPWALNIETPIAIALSNDEQNLFVLSSLGFLKISATTANSTPKNIADAAFVTSKKTTNFLISSDGKQAFVIGSTQIIPIDLVAETVGTPIDLATLPYGVALSGNNIYFIDPKNRILICCDLTLKSKWIMPVAGTPTSLTVSATGEKIYVGLTSLSPPYLPFLTVVSSDWKLPPILIPLTSTPNQMRMATDKKIYIAGDKSITPFLTDINQTEGEIPLTETTTGLVLGSLLT